MRIDFIQGAFLALLMSSSSVVLGQDSEIELLRTALDELRSDYDARIADLERRLALAEQKSTDASYVANQATVQTGSDNSAFNPAIGVVFTGSAWNYSRDPDNYAVQGFPYGGEAGPISQGLALGETELIFNASVDDKFTAWLTAALAVEDGEAVVEVEEAWVEATALPAGFGLRFGRFFSGIGYLNSKHAHAWDFADQPLPYQAFLAGQLVEDGVQVRWLAPTDVFLELGGEVLRGEQYPAAGAADSGFGSYSLFANIGGDLGTNSSWLAGVSYLDSTAIERSSGDEDDPYLFTGDSRLATAQAVWKWSPNGNWKDRNFILQAEYLQRRENGEYSGPGLSPTLYEVDQSGWYVQGIYQPVQRWRVGARVDTLRSGETGAAFDGTLLAAPVRDPRRYSFMTDWSNSEFSRLRLQFTRDEAGPEKDNQWGLQYTHSIGAHGAHSF